MILSMYYTKLYYQVFYNKVIPIFILFYIEDKECNTFVRGKFV